MAWIWWCDLAVLIVLHSLVLARTDGGDAAPVWISPRDVRRDRRLNKNFVF